MNMEPILNFRTSDLPLIAFLRYKGFVVLRIEKISDYKCEFIFEDVDRQILDDYQTENAAVEPRKFSSIMHQQIQAAKSKLRE